MGHVLRSFNSLLTISETETLFSRRGFARTESHKRELLEQAGGTFVKGYNLAMATDRVGALCEELDRIGHERRGFAYEGAAMAFALTDHLWHSKPLRWRQLLEGGGGAHKYMLYVGYGWALARLPWLRWNPGAVLARHACLEKWLILDGYGFHEGFFRPKQSVAEGKLPRALSTSDARTFDQGLGRSIWFSAGADIRRIALTIGSFRSSRQADLWSGIGLAATYAGGATQTELEQLRDLAGNFADHLAQGSAFAAQARHFAQADVPATGLATGVLCGRNARQAAAMTDLARRTVSCTSHRGYESWRAALRTYLRASEPPVAHSGANLATADALSQRD